jgi:CRP/FNR family transcriptional regulator
MIDSKITEDVLMDNSKFAMMMFQVASEMFKKSVLNFISLAHKQKEGRIADIILYLSEEVYLGTTFLLSLTRKEIAEFAGCSTENVIMTLSKWQNEKIVSLEGKTIVIKDVDKLKYISKIG